ncbi:unnamed protein product [Cochlearia groenlandica]
MVLDMKLEAVNKKVDGFYNELNAKFEQLSRKVDNTPLPNSKGKESCKAITLRSVKGPPFMYKENRQEESMVMINHECSAIIQRNLPPKLDDPGSFTLP